MRPLARSIPSTSLEWKNGGGGEVQIWEKGGMRVRIRHGIPSYLCIFSNHFSFPWKVTKLGGGSSLILVWKTVFNIFFEGEMYLFNAGQKRKYYVFKIQKFRSTLCSVPFQKTILF